MLEKPGTPIVEPPQKKHHGDADSLSFTAQLTPTRVKRSRAVLMSDAEFQPFSGTKKLPHAMYCFNKVVHLQKFGCRYSKSWCLFEMYLLANVAMLIYCLGIIYGKFELG